MAPQSVFNVLIGRAFCSDSSIFQPICIAAIFLVFGQNVQQLNTVGCWKSKKKKFFFDTVIDCLYL